jgi:hypothetical protein
MGETLGESFCLRDQTGEPGECLPMYKMESIPGKWSSRSAVRDGLYTRAVTQGGAGEVGRQVADSVAQVNILPTPGFVLGVMFMGRHIAMCVWICSYTCTLDRPM